MDQFPTLQADLKPETTRVALQSAPSSYYQVQCTAVYNINIVIFLKIILVQETRMNE